MFWDFDGVIIDSVDVKTRAYVKLFEIYGADIAERVREHHEAHGGMSRFDKMPLYLQWAGEKCNQSLVNQFCNRFASMVFSEVIASPWVPGVESYIRANAHRQTFILVSATPQDELEKIVYNLNLTDCFAEIIGAPIPKEEALRRTLEMRKRNPHESLMIGDAQEDYSAAKANNVPFLLRLHGKNSAFFPDYSGPSVKDFIPL